MNEVKFFLSLLKFAIKYPSSGLEILQTRYDVWKDSRKKILHSFDSDCLELNACLKTLFSNENYSIPSFRKNTAVLNKKIDDFFNFLKNKEYPSRIKPYPLFYTLDKESGFFLYSICKILKPDKVVETGVAYGLGSTFILQSLKENQKGKLFSIDDVFRPWESKNMIGSIIPDDLKSNWEIHFGTSKNKLKSILESLGEIDIFFHDSLHTSKNMLFEFNTVWPFLKKGGFLLSDDIGSNNSFYEFYSAKNVKPTILIQKKPDKSFFGILKK